MGKLSQLFENNKNWVNRLNNEDPDFFSKLSTAQSPDYLWISCSDSRVAASQIVDLLPGNLFVHRNIANVVVHSDLNSQSVIQYAVEVLKIKYIIVCGHYGCGGVKAAMEHQSLGTIDHWLRHIKDVYNRHKEEINNLSSPKQQVNRMCELNVQAQVENVSNSSFVQRAWKNGQELTVHGLIYNLADGTLKDLGVSVDSAKQTSAIFSMN